MGASDVPEPDVDVVNRGRWHKPVAASPTSVLLLDATGTLTTGDVNDGVPIGIPTLDGTEPRS